MKWPALFLAGALALGGGASAQTETPDTAWDAMEELRAAGDALEAAEGARDRVAALTQTVQAYESGLAALREGLRQATIRERAIEGVFAAESDRLARLLGVLQAIQAAPEPHLLLHPDGPLGTVRAGIVVSDVTPALTREAMELKEALQEVAVLRALQEAAVTTLEEGLAGAQRARTELSKAISERTDLPRRFITDTVAMENLLNSADTLESFAGGLLSASVEDPSVSVEAPDFTTAQGQLGLPVLGRVIRGYNEADAAGVRRPGWVVATRPLTLVTTPWPATIRYLGPLLDYGEVAILEPGEGYLLVLAGLGQLFGEVGEVLPKDTPIGLMGGSTLAADQGFLISSPQGGGAEASESLYIELRRNGTPVDPAEWFARAENG
ncbi:murein hydrolase activator EnvC family protein [Sinisalibacter aestuarii]|uniref:Peptidase M23 n=1 Tax=Sinisalibacter aestuarii TaxID=2949426 RepID=A0ABQ5LMZ5_9RHOB|nr:peptidase M23 [Sinisalibacter aestuarii]GKY86334.1 peptidase M23 [Sinisalibacter aestuarii]